MNIVVFRSRKNGQWYFRIVARNGKTVAQSEGYRRRRSALTTINRIRLYASSSRVREIVS